MRATGASPPSPGSWPDSRPPAPSGLPRTVLPHAAQRSQPRLKSAARGQYAVPPAVASDGPKSRAFTCFCEDVSAKDIGRCVKEGYDSIELCKRYTTVTMGPCQGRMCQLTSIRLMAQETGQKLEQVGTTTARPPWSTVPMGALAGRPIEPAKRSSIHARHRELGARIQWAGDWRRAYDYGDPEGEALAVHSRRRPDRRLDARQAAGQRPRGGRVPRPALPEPDVDAEAGSRALRRADFRRRPDHGRRHGQPSRRGDVLRHDHLERRRRR